MIKNLAAFTGKSDINRAIDGVHMAPDKIVATDSYKLIEIKQDTGVPAPFTVQLPKGMKTFESAALKNDTPYLKDKKGAEMRADIIRDEFPKYEQVIPTKKPRASIILSPAHLKEIASAFVEVSGTEGVLIEIHGEHEPVVFSNKKASVHALLTPIMK